MDERLQKVQAELDGIAAPYVKALGLKLMAIDGNTVTVMMPITPQLVHGGGVVCGQSVLAAADTVMVVALCAVLGGFKPMTTVQLGASFLRPIPGDLPSVTLTCTVLRTGRTLAFGEIDICLPDGKLAAQASTTYAFL